MRNKKGISLIVLVITIIVMIILAASVVVTLSNTGVIDRAGQAVDLTNEKQISDFAALAWSDAFMDGERTQSGLESAVINALTTNGVNTNTLDINVTTSGVSVAKKKIYTADEIAADSNIFAVGKTNANDVLAIYNPDTKTVTIRKNTVSGNGEMKNGSVASSFRNVKATTEHLVVEHGVENIGEWQLYDFTNLKTATLSNTVKVINSAAFYGCTSLTNIELPKSLIEIGSSAFSDCSAITTLTIPASVTTIGKNIIKNKSVVILFEEGFDITLETINQSAFAYYSYSGKGSTSEYDFATRYGNVSDTVTTTDYARNCSNGWETLHDYGYGINVTINGKTRLMDFHYKAYGSSCSY